MPAALPAEACAASGVALPAGCPSINDIAQTMFKNLMAKTLDGDDEVGRGGGSGKGTPTQEAQR